MKPVKSLEQTPIARTKPAVFVSTVRLAIWGILLSGMAVWCWQNAPLAPYLDRLPWFPVEEIRIRSQWPLAPATVKSWLPPLKGKSLLSVRPASLMALLERKPWVESVTIKKEYPNRVTFDVGTKRPFAVAVVRGQPYFADSQGQLIDRTTPALLKAFDLPVISVEKESEAALWPMAAAMRVLSGFRAGIDSRYSVSEVVLGSFPYFKVFLARERLEIAFNYENWERQLPILALLLRRPSSLIGQLQRINLLFPKKAIVSPSLSK